MSDYIGARNDRERMGAVRRHLHRAIDAFPTQHLPGQRKSRAQELAVSATTCEIPEPQRQQPSDRLEALRQRLDPRLNAIKAGVELQKLLVPALTRWMAQTRTRAETFLEQEDDMSDERIERNLVLFESFAEAARALDACFLALTGRIHVPYRRALMNAYGAFVDEQVPDLMALLALQDEVQWGTSGNVPYLGNPVQGPLDYPEWLALEVGVRPSLDFQLMGAVWADAAAHHALSAMVASNPGRHDSTLQMGAQLFVGPLEQKVCKLLLPSWPRYTPIDHPEVQRSVWLVLGSMQELCAWCGSDVQTRCPLLVDMLRRMRSKHRLAELDPRLAPPAAVVALGGGPLMPNPPPPQQPPSQAQPQPVAASSFAQAALAVASLASTSAALPAVAAAAVGTVAAAHEGTEAAQPAAVAVGTGGATTATATNVAGTAVTSRSWGLASGWQVMRDMLARRGVVAQGASAVGSLEAGWQPAAGGAGPAAATAAALATPSTTAPTLGGAGAHAPAAAPPAGVSAADRGRGSSGGGAALPRPEGRLEATVAAGASGPAPVVEAGAEGSDEGEGEEEGGEEEGAAAGGSGSGAQQQEGAAEGGAARRRRKKNKKGRGKGKGKGRQQAPDGGGAVSALLAALAAQEPECAVCMQDWGGELGGEDTNFLSCTVISAAGPFHALCNTCWLGLLQPQCPLCRKDDVEALAPQEFLAKLAERQQRQ